MEVQGDWKVRSGAWGSGLGSGVVPLGEAVSEVLDRGSRQREAARGAPVDGDDGSKGEYRRRFPTNSERLNRSLVELGLSAFKVHTLVWQWRGAPARGTLPYFTIRSLEKFCNLTRPTVRVALRELVGKGWIERLPYNKHHKNTLYRLVSIRKVPAPS